MATTKATPHSSPVSNAPLTGDGAPSQSPTLGSGSGGNSHHTNRAASTTNATPIGELMRSTLGLRKASSAAKYQTISRAISQDNGPMAANDHWYKVTPRWRASNALADIQNKGKSMMTGWSRFVSWLAFLCFECLRALLAMWSLPAKGPLILKLLQVMAQHGLLKIANSPCQGVNEGLTVAVGVHVPLKCFVDFYDPVP